MISNFKKRMYTSIILLFVVLIIMNYNFLLVYSLLLLGVISLLEFINITIKIQKNRFYLFAIILLYLIYIFLFCYLFLYFVSFYQLKIILFTLLFGCIASDIGGYIIGKIIKGPKLTKISPNKTISGSIGSIIFTYIVIASTFFYFTNKLELEIFIISVITSLSCQAGDLLFSLLKRKAKIKDTGNFLPGHGGVLDRIDGILIGIPLGFLFLIIVY